MIILLCDSHHLRCVQQRVTYFWSLVQACGVSSPGGAAVCRAASDDITAEPLPLTEKHTTQNIQV